MLLVPPRNPATVAEAIGRALERRDELARAALKTAEEHFTLAVCGRLTVEAYEDALR
jgi:glycosyltransferase involved in cell wall biosynthesis